ncbi:hypothetical protein BCR39DRAFT_549716 [Naematelia encephala]|uniref:Extracellular membrane protein CFEM domain-containing protein n=1 Tax=Naematelia encephala TaxID=71784 RepID=A0A1Y2AL11_9TREE|nr:hypothetical protein BCR39DRAFT_549716 [Naematelia encephala]
MLSNVYRPLLALALLMLLPSILASAQSQFKLDLDRDISTCWIDCSGRVTDTINLPGRDINDPSFITKNCQFDDYLSYMSACLAQVCQSAPDAAYAVEYGREICHKAGVDISNFTLPQSYLEEASEYFTSAEYTSRGVRGVQVWGIPGWLLVLSPLALVLL